MKPARFSPGTRNIPRRPLPDLPNWHIAYATCHSGTPPTVNADSGD